MAYSASDRLPPILVAEDDPSARALISAFLDRLLLANPVVHAGDGDEAVAALEDLDPPPILTLLDVRMPRRSGLDVLRWIRDRHGLADLPVILLTGFAEAEQVDEAHRLGATSYLVKPVGYEALGEVLRSLRIPWAFQRAESARPVAR